MTRTPTIECKANGPYVVKDLRDLRDSNGVTIPSDAEMALCRCGGSANKPFCDGTHRKNGFSGARLTDGGADTRRDYRGLRITVHDNRALCAHAGHCTTALASVFKYGSEPWIDPDGAAVEQIVQTIRKCPSGALSYSLDGVQEHDQHRTPSITVTKNGPYAVVGAIALLDQTPGQGAPTDPCTLCRCGGSRNKPYCDGTHWSIGFEDDKS